MPDCYLTLELLPDELRPAFVHREDGITLLTIDPRSTRAEASLASLSLLTQEEAGIYNDAYRAAMPAVDCEEGACDLPVLLYVPPSVRLDGDQPTQGGPELLRRYEAGAMPVEMLMIAAEYAAAG